jgi:hypothetical protein
MSFASAISALIAAAVATPALVALYFLKLRRRQVSVPSTLLWQKAIQDMQVNTPFQRLRNNLLLWLQLLILLALLVALAGPRLWASSEPGQRVVVVIDRSASMQAPAQPGGPTRLAKAKDAAERVIDNLGSGEGAAEAMVVSYASRPKVEAGFTSDPARLRQALDDIEPTDQLSRLGPALKLIEPHARQASSTNQNKLTVHVISDGRVHREKGALPGLSGASLNFVQVAKARQPNNIAVVAMSARRSFETPERVQVFARVANFGDKAVRTNLTLRVGGQTARVEPITVPAGGMRSSEAASAMATAFGNSATGNDGNSASDGGGADNTNDAGAASGTDDSEDGMTFQPGTESVQFEFTLPGEALVELSHDHDDALAVDDATSLKLAPAKRLRALLVTNGNAFLKRVIKSVGVRQLVTMSPDEYANQDVQTLKRRDAGTTAGGPGSGFDVIVFDGVSPKTLPPVATISFGATPPIDGLGRKQPANANQQRGQVILDWRRSHPTMRYVELSDLVLGHPGWLALPSEATVLATAQRGPVIAQIPAKGRPHVVTSFPVLQSNWPMQVSFPVFVSNALQRLGLGGLLDEAGLAFRSGETAAVPVLGNVSEVTYEGPVTLTAPVADDQAVLGPFSRVGVYETSANVEAPYNHLPVNLLDTTESDLRPVQKLQVAGGSINANPSARAIQKPIWPWFVIAALAVLMLEWLFYTRRMRV